MVWRAHVRGGKAGEGVWKGRSPKPRPQAKAPPVARAGSTRVVSCLLWLTQHRVQAVQRVLGLLPPGGSGGEQKRHKQRLSGLATRSGSRCGNTTSSNRPGSVHNVPWAARLRRRPALPSGGAHSAAVQSTRGCGKRPGWAPAWSTTASMCMCACGKQPWWRTAEEGKPQCQRGGATEHAPSRAALPMNTAWSWHAPRGRPSA